MTPFREPDPAAQADRHVRELARLKAEHRRELDALREAAESGRPAVLPWLVVFGVGVVVGLAVAGGDPAAHARVLATGAAVGFGVSLAMRLVLLGLAALFRRLSR